MRFVQLLALMVALPCVAHAENNLAFDFKSGFTSDDNANRAGEDVKAQSDAQWRFETNVWESYWIPGFGQWYIGGNADGQLSRFRGMSRLTPGVDAGIYGSFGNEKVVHDLGNDPNYARITGHEFLLGLRARAGYDTWSLHPVRDGWTASGSFWGRLGLFTTGEWVAGELTARTRRDLDLHFGADLFDHRSASDDPAQKAVFDTRSYRGWVGLNLTPRLRAGPLRWIDRVDVRYSYRLGDLHSTSDMPSLTTAAAAEASVLDPAFDGEPKTDSLGNPIGPPSDSTTYRLDAQGHVVRAEITRLLGRDADGYFSFGAEYEVLTAAPDFRTESTRWFVNLAWTP